MNDSALRVRREVQWFIHTFNKFYVEIDRSKGNARTCQKTLLRYGVQIEMQATPMSPTRTPHLSILPSLGEQIQNSVAMPTSPSPPPTQLS